jgi:hypothetical protein
MSGRKGRSGRPQGSISWTPTALTGLPLINFRRHWQLGVPFRIGDRTLLMPDRWELRVPVQVDRALAQMAIEHAVGVYGFRRRPRVELVIAWANRHDRSF